MLHLCDPPVEGPTNEGCRCVGGRNGLAHPQLSTQTAATSLQRSFAGFVVSGLLYPELSQGSARRSLLSPSKRQAAKMSAEDVAEFFDSAPIPKGCYYRSGCLHFRLGWVIIEVISLSFLPNQRYEAFALLKGATFGPLSEPSAASTPKRPATRCSRAARSSVILPLADSTSRIAARTVRRWLTSLVNSFGIAANAPS